MARIRNTAMAIALRVADGRDVLACHGSNTKKYRLALFLEPPLEDHRTGDVMESLSGAAGTDDDY